MNKAMEIHAVDNKKNVPNILLIRWVAFFMCALGAVFYCYEYYLRVTPSVICADLMQSYNISEAGLGVLVAWYYWAYIPLQIPVGLMMDQWGPRRILTCACMLCAMGTYFFAGTNILVVAKLGRFMVGFGSAFAYVGVLKIANLWLPRRFFAMMAGLCTALGMLGAMSGTVFMNKFVDLVGWKRALYTSAFVGFVLSLVLWIFIRDRSDQEITRCGRALHEGSSLKEELLEIIKMKQLVVNGAIGALMYLPLTVFSEMWAITFLKTLEFNKEHAAFGSSLVFLGFGIGGPIWGLISDKLHSRRKPLIVGSVIASICAVAMLYYSPSVRWMIYVLLFSCGLFASAQVLVFAVGNDICRPGLSATVVSYTNLFVMLSGIIQPLVGYIMDYLQQPIQNALMILPLGLILSAFLGCFLLRESYHSRGFLVRSK